MKINLIARISIFQACLLTFAYGINAAAIKWYDGINPVTIAIDTKTDLVVNTAIEMFSNDMEEVTGTAASVTKPSKSTIILSQLDKASRSSVGNSPQLASRLHGSTPSSMASTSPPAMAKYTSPAPMAAVQPMVCSSFRVMQV